jgi:cyanophycin synthetase
MTKKTIEVLRVIHLRGPNIWTYRQVIEAWLDIGDLEDYPSNTLPGFYERLTGWLPGLAVHRCGVGEPGGFLMRLQDGTWAGHVLEHVALELQNMAGMATGFGKTRQTSRRGVYKMAFRTRHIDVGQLALNTGLDLVHAAIHDRAFDVCAAVQTLKLAVDRHCLGPGTSSIVDGAHQRGVPSIRLTDGNLVQLGYGAAQRRIWTAETDQTSAIAEEIASDKDLTKSLLKACGVPVPAGELVRSAEQAWEAAQDLGLPVVLKPYNGNHGRGVSLNLRTQDEVSAAFQVAQARQQGPVIVEQYIPGTEHRLLVVGRRMVAAARGDSAWVVGDGVRTVAQLIDAQINSDPRRGTTEDSPLSVLSVAQHPEIGLELSRQGLSPEAVPKAGQRVLIQHNGNVAVDITDAVHPSVAEVAALAVRVVGLDIAGVDMVLQDASQPIQAQRAAVIEVNASPGLLAHLKPAQGQPRAVGQAIVDHLFAPGVSARVPVVGFAGVHGSALAARLTAWVIHLGGQRVGLASQEGFFLGNRCVQPKDSTAFAQAQRVLMNRAVQVAVFDTPAQTILSQGFPYDRCQVGVVLDAQDWQPLVPWFIDDADRLFSTLRSQVDLVLPGGWAVLNAQDPAVLEMAGLCDGQVMLFSSRADDPAVLAHLAQGQRALVLEGGQVIARQGDAEVFRLSKRQLAPVLRGQQTALLAAVGAAWALGLAPDIMAAGLKTLDSSLTLE